MWTYFDNTVIMTTSAYIIIICRISMENNEYRLVGWFSTRKWDNKTIGTEGLKSQLRMYFLPKK